jgi:hypothetical protein
MKTNKKSDKKVVQKKAATCQKTRSHNPDNLPFRWEIDQEYYRQQKSLMFFCKNTLSVLRKLESGGIESKELTLTWKEVDKRKHTHKFGRNEVSEKYREFFRQFCDRREMEGEIFYQLPGKASGAHRIVGYRKDGIFYLMMDDEKHEMFSEK